MPYPQPPDKFDLFWFLFTGLFAMLGEILRSMHAGESKPWVVWVGEVFSVGFWGGLTGWLLAYYTNLDAPALASISAVIGHFGHRGVLTVTMQLVKRFTGLDFGDDDRR